MLLQETAENLLGHVVNRLANGIFPPLDDITAAGLEQHPELVFHFLDEMAESYQPLKADEALPIEYQAAYCLFSECLLELRLAAEKKRVWAHEMIAELQQIMVEEFFVAEYGQHLQQDLLEAIREAGLEISPELKNAHFELMAYYGRFWNRNADPDLEDVLAMMEEDGLTNIYDQANTIIAQLEMSPEPEDQIHILEGMAASVGQKGSEVLSLMLMHPRAMVRQMVPNLIMNFADRQIVSPDTMWRMIALRNQIPEEERPALDRAITHCRKARVNCAQKKAGHVASLYAGAMDGNGSQVLWIVVATDPGWLVCHVLFKLDFGIREIWLRETPDLESLADLTSLFDEEESLMLPVDASYLLHMTAHFLAEGNRNGMVCPPNLLRLMEALGEAHLSASFLDTETVLEDQPLISEKRQNRIIEESDAWSADHLFIQSWFEDDEDVDNLLESGLFDAGEALVDPDVAESMIIRYILEPRRDQWARCFLITAFWLQNVTDHETDWQHFLILSKALQRGKPLMEIPLMVVIAAQTIYAAILRNGEAPFDQDLF